MGALLGDTYVQHYDESNHETGYSEERTDLLGDTYTEHHTQEGEDAGWSEDRTDLLGDDYVQHHSTDNSNTGWSEERTGILGDHYIQHHRHIAPGVSAGASQSQKRISYAYSANSSSTSNCSSDRGLKPNKRFKGFVGSIAGRFLSWAYLTATIGFWIWNFYLGARTEVPNQRFNRCRALFPASGLRPTIPFSIF